MRSLENIQQFAQKLVAQATNGGDNAAAAFSTLIGHISNYPLVKLTRSTLLSDSILLNAVCKENALIPVAKAIVARVANAEAASCK